MFEFLKGKPSCQKELKSLWEQKLSAEEAFMYLKAKGYSSQEIKDACLKELSSITKGST